MIPRFRVFTAGLVAWAGVLTADAAPASGPDVREFWVPQKHLAEVLKASPKAVLLTAEQYAALWRDSRPGPETTEVPPPVPAVLRSARYQGTPGDRFVTMRGEFSLECLTDDWTEVPLALHPSWLGKVTVDGTTAVQPAGDAGSDQAALKAVVRGRGRHELTVDFAVPVQDEAGRRSLEMMMPGAAEAVLTLTAPDGLKLESAEPFVRENGAAVFALSPEPRPFRVSWSKQDLAPLETAAASQDFRIRYSIDATRLEAELEIGWHSPLRPLPPQLVLPLPADVNVLGVDGPEVRQWTLAGDRLVVDLSPEVRREASLRLVLERGLAMPEAGGPVKLLLPAPVAEGVSRASGQFSIFAAEDLRVRQVRAGTLTERDDSRNPVSGGKTAFGTWVFPLLPAAPEVEIEPLRVQFAAMLDTQISLTCEAVRLKRWLTLTPRDGTLFSPRLEGLLAGEEIESVTTPAGVEPAWRKTETGLIFPDNQGIAAGAPWTVVVSSRLDPAGWQTMTEMPLTLSMTSASVPGAVKVNGYVALDSEDALLVSTPVVTGLETRDPRQFAGVLPLTGRMAWSRLEEYQLDLAVARRAPEYDAEVVLYALPLLNSLEVEGALILTMDRSPLKEVRVVFPAEAAAAVRWDSPLLAESLLQPDNSWRLRFHQEMDGAPVLRFRLSTPLAEDAPAPGAENPDGPARRFRAAAPVPSVPGARRLHGTVVVEANTDTELSFTASGMNALDTLRAPALAGYTPRHRLVSAWGWLGGEPSLLVGGVRHRPGALVSTVVDKLELDTVVSQDGPLRHQARMEVRTAGDQYLDVTLPDQARVLTLLVNEAAVKPVRNRQGGLRIPLPDRLAVVRLICECPGEPMTAAARRKLVPITLGHALPVLETKWQLHLPEGFTYSGFDSNLTPAADEKAKPVPGVLELAFAELNPLSGKTKSGRATAKGPVLTEDQRRTREKERVALIAKALEMKVKVQEEEVERSRVEMMQLMKKHRIVDMSIMTGRGLSPTIGTGDQAYSASQMSLLEMKTKIATLKANLESMQRLGEKDLVENAAAYGVNDSTIQSFDAQLKKDRIEYVRMTNSGFGKTHPKVVALEKSITETSKILHAAALNHQGSLAVTIKNLEDAVARMESISEARKEQSVEEKSKSAEYSQARNIYEMKLDLLNQMRETALRTQANELRLGEGLIRGQIFSEPSFSETAPPPLDYLPGGAVAGSGLETRTFKVPADFILPVIGAYKAGVSSRPPAENMLIQLGIEFGDNASAAYSEETSTLVVRNTPEQLANFEAVLVPLRKTRQSGENGVGKVSDSDREGLLPLNFALPEGGRVYRFDGQYAPGTVEFRYESWERRMQWSWFWMIAGGVLFWILSGGSPWFAGLLGLVLLQGIPAALGRADWLPAANALTLGWTAGAALRVVRWAFRRRGVAEPVLLTSGQAVVLMGAWLISAADHARAEQVMVKPVPEVPMVVVPYDPAQPLDQVVPDRRYLSYETFEKLWAAAKENRARAAARLAGAPAGGEQGAILTSALHRAVVDGAVLRVEAVFGLQTRGADWVKVPFGMPQGLRSLLLDDAPAALKDGHLLVEKAGAHTVTAVYEVALPAGWQEVAWPVPAAAGTSLTVSQALEDPSRLGVNAEAPVVEEEAEGRRVFTAMLGNAPVISLKRRLSVERSGAQAAEPPLAQFKTRVYLTPALERIESAVTFVFAGQSRSVFTLRMDEGLVPVSFTVPGLEMWTLRREGGEQVLELRLERPVQDGFSASLVAERPVGALPLTEAAPWISGKAGRVEQEWSVLATDDLEVRPLAAPALQRVDFAKAAGTGDEGFDAVGTWQAAGAAEALRWELKTKVPEASAVVRYALQPGADKLELSAGMELRPAPGRELRELTIRVPEDAVIQGVTGDRLTDWWHEGSALQVRFSAGGAEVTRLALHLTRATAEGAGGMTFQPLVIEGFEKVSGSGLLIAPVNQEAVLRLEPAGPNLREVAPREAQAGFIIRHPLEEKRGFVFEGAGWTAGARLAPLTARYEVDWVMDAEVRDSWVALNTRVLLTLTRGGVDRVVFTVPASAPEFRVVSDDVRETVSVVEGAVRRYTVSFQTLMTDAVLFTLTGQMPHAGSAALPDLELAGAARTSRFVIVNNKSDGELKVETAGVETTPREQVSFLPEELVAGQSGARFYAAREGWSMKLAVEKLETTAGQAAVVLQADLTTSLLRNGELWQRAVYVVQNRALQFLPVHLPPDAEVIAVSVGGDPTRADAGTVGGLPVLLVPLIQTAAGELATEVKLIYRRRGTPGRFPDVLDDPDLPGLSIGRTFWTVQYPDGYALEADGGNMTPVEDSGLDAEKAWSRLSELVSLRSIAKSDKYDEKTRAMARRNAQVVAAAYESSLSKDGKYGDAPGTEGADAEVGQLLQEVKEEGTLAAPQEKPAARSKEPVDGVKTKEFKFNKLKDARVSDFNKKPSGLKASDLTLNDNVAWSSGSEEKPRTASDAAAAAPAGNRRLSQIEKLEQGGRAGAKPGAASVAMADFKGKAAPTKEAQELSRMDFNLRNNAYSFQNTRLNNGSQPAETPASAPPANAPKPEESDVTRTTTAAPATDAAPAADPFASGSADGDSRPRLRTTGRSSLEGVFPEQRNALHFRKVKGDAVMRMQVEQPWSARMDRSAALWLGGCTGALLLVRLLQAKRRRADNGTRMRKPSVSTGVI